jgi:hypothetical protein
MLPLLVPRSKNRVKPITSGYTASHFWVSELWFAEYVSRYNFRKCAAICQRRLKRKITKFSACTASLCTCNCVILNTRQVCQHLRNEICLKLIMSKLYCLHRTEKTVLCFRWELIGAGSANVIHLLGNASLTFKYL